MWPPQKGEATLIQYLPHRLRFIFHKKTSSETMGIHNHKSQLLNLNLRSVTAAFWMFIISPKCCSVLSGPCLLVLVFLDFPGLSFMCVQMGFYGLKCSGPIVAVNAQIHLAPMCHVFSQVANPLKVLITKITEENGFGWIMNFYLVELEAPCRIERLPAWAALMIRFGAHSVWDS